MTTNKTNERGRGRLLEEILETVRTIDEHVEKVLDRLEELGHSTWYGPGPYDDGHEY